MSTPSRLPQIECISCQLPAEWMLLNLETQPAACDKHMQLLVQVYKYDGLILPMPHQRGLC